MARSRPLFLSRPLPSMGANGKAAAKPGNGKAAAKGRVAVARAASGALERVRRGRGEVKL